MHSQPQRTRSTVRFVRRAAAHSRRSVRRPLAAVAAAIVVSGLAVVTTATGSVVAPSGPERPDYVTRVTPSRESDVLAVATPTTSSKLAPATPIPLATLDPSPAPTLITPPPCTYADEPALDVGYDAWQHTLVDTTWRLPKGYEPPDLVPVSSAGLTGGGLIRALAIPDLRAMAKAARAAGAPLAVQSAYRSEARQKQVFAGWVRSSGRADARRFSARPGHSEHQLGTTIDFRASGGRAPWNGDFASTRQGRWMADSAWRFGWVLSYPVDALEATCYEAEPWHYRYVGRDVAAAVRASGTTLRAWLWSQASTD